MRQSKVSRKQYVVGFGSSVVMTIVAFWLVINSSLYKPVIAGSIMILAVIQLIIQLVFFLHLNKEGKPHWNLYVFVFMLMVVGIIVGGSLWIMYNLDYSHGGHRHYESPSQIINDEGVKL